MKILILGHKRHGKDTLAQLIKNKTGLTFKSSSEKAAEIFIFDALKDKCGYKTVKECFNDRVNRRAEWHTLISDYNKEDKSKLAMEILKENDMYVGMRCENEIRKCIQEGIFDMIIGVYDYRKEEEDKDSFNMNMFEFCDYVICTNGTVEQLEEKVNNFCKLLK